MQDTKITTEVNWKPTQGRINKTVTKINFKKNETNFRLISRLKAERWLWWIHSSGIKKFFMNINQSSYWHSTLVHYPFHWWGGRGWRHEWPVHSYTDKGCLLEVHEYHFIYSAKACKGSFMSSIVLRTGEKQRCMRLWPCSWQTLNGLGKILIS